MASQIAQIDGSHRALRQTHASRHLARRRALASLSHGLLEALALGRFARQLGHLFDPYPTARAPYPVRLYHHRRPVLEAGQVAHFPLAHLVDQVRCNVLPTPRTNQLQPCLFPSHPQLQILAMLVYVHAIDLVSRPSQYPRPLDFPHPLRLAAIPLFGKASLSGGLSDSCSVPPKWTSRLRVPSPSKR